mmetsp:Transcript_8269/g.10833  ORF Transcript_8269/g.10833 Transcript_8269/m.10833 type:complete len:180 (+) Transcript_8269:85-624(+)
MSGKNKSYHYFWGGPTTFSQWLPSKYELEGFEYICAEQGMMHGKALLFNDHSTAEKIMQTSNPKIMKSLGRKVEGFDNKIWEQSREEIVYRNSVAKFTQSPELMEALISVGSLEIGSVVLVEASPFDRIWGIGMNEKTARATPPAQWIGLNLLGIILTRVRDEALEDKLRKTGVTSQCV